MGEVGAAPQRPVGRPSATCCRHARFDSRSGHRRSVEVLRCSACSLCWRFKKQTGRAAELPLAKKESGAVGRKPPLARVDTSSSCTCTVLRKQFRAPYRILFLLILFLLPDLIICAALGRSKPPSRVPNTLPARFATTPKDRAMISHSDLVFRGSPTERLHDYGT